MKYQPLNLGRWLLWSATALLFAVGSDASLLSVAQGLHLTIAPGLGDFSLFKLSIAQIAPILPYLFLVLILIFRPKGLLGTREG